MIARKRAIKNAKYGALEDFTMCSSGEKFSNITFIHRMVSEKCMEKSKLSQALRKVEGQAKHRDLLYRVAAVSLEICLETRLSESSLNNDSF